MGISYSTHVGPYVECLTEMKDTTQTIRTCSNPACKRYEEQKWEKTNKFCTACGKPIQSRQTPIKTTAVDHGEIQEKIEEALYTVPGDEFYSWMGKNHTHLWLPNRASPGIYFDPLEGMQYRPIGADVIEKEVAEFSESYKKELAVLRKEYGTEQVAVKWGLIHYLN